MRKTLLVLLGVVTLAACIPTTILGPYTEATFACPEGQAMTYEGSPALGKILCDGVPLEDVYCEGGTATSIPSGVRCEGPATTTTVPATTTTAPPPPPAPPKLETQGWRAQNDHIHTSWPGEQFQVIDAPFTLPVTTLLHNRNGGALTFVRWGTDDANIVEVVNMNVPGTGESEQKIVTNLTIDPSLLPSTGWKEVRVTSNFITAEGAREFTTSRWCVFVPVQAGKPVINYCGGPLVQGRCGGGAWYDDDAPFEYSIVFTDCRDVARFQQPIYGGETIRAKSQVDTGKLHAYLDPSFHAVPPSLGTVLLQNGAVNTWHTLTIPTGLTPGLHKIVFVDDRTSGGVTTNAGVSVQYFTVGEP